MAGLRIEVYTGALLVFLFCMERIEIKSVIKLFVPENAFLRMAENFCNKMDKAKSSVSVYGCVVQLAGKNLKVEIYKYLFGILDLNIK